MASSIPANGFPTVFTSKDPETDAHDLKSDLNSNTPFPFMLAPASLPNRSTRKPTLKARVAAGETLYGLFLMSASPIIAEIAGLAGYDFVVVDMEHGPGGISDALPCVRALAAADTPAVIRVPEKSAAWAKKALDLGPQGIMFPMVENARIAEQVVSYCRYPPRGIRGTAHVMVRASGYGTDDSYLERCEEELLIFCMVETEAGVKEIEAIASVDGVDCIQMGPRDLGASMGYLRDPGNAKVREVMMEAERKVVAMHKPSRGPYLGGIATPHHKPDDLRMRGYSLVAGGVDVGVFRQAAVEDVKRFRSGATPAAANGVHVPSAA